MAGMALNSLYSLVDAFWLGKMRVGAREALAAVGPTAALSFIVVAFGTGFGSGGTALVAQHTGAKRPRQADEAAGQTLLLLPLVTTVMASLMFIFASQVLSLLQTPTEVKPKALAFLRIILIGMPFIAFNIGYGSALRALGDTLTMVMIGVCTNLLNFVLSPLLIFGLGPVPAMGIRGAATVGAFAEVMTAVTCVVLLRRGRSGLRLTRADFRPNKQIIRQIFRIGLPAGVSMCSNSLGFLALQAMISSLGTTVMGAYTVGSRIIEICGIPSWALAMSTAPVVGQALGAGKPELARRAVRTSVMLFAFGMLAPYALIMAEGHLVARAFINDARVIAEAGRFFLIVPASNYFFNVLTVLMSAFYGSGHTRPVMAISLLRQWGLRIPIALLLGFRASWKSLGIYFGLAWGSIGIYLGLAGGNVIAAALAWWVFSMGAWERAVVPSRAETSDAASTTPETTRT